MTNEFIIASVAKLVDQLRKRIKNKNDFDLVREIMTYQKELETNATQVEAKVTELEREISRLKEAQPEEITRLKKEHAEEVARLRKPPPTRPWLEDVGGVH